MFIRLAPGFIRGIKCRLFVSSLSPLKRAFVTFYIYPQSVTICRSSNMKTAPKSAL